MSPCDFHMFGPLKKHLKGKYFNSDDELKDAVKEKYSSPPQKFWEHEILWPMGSLCSGLWCTLWTKFHLYLQCCFVAFHSNTPCIYRKILYRIRIGLTFPFSAFCSLVYSFPYLRLASNLQLIFFVFYYVYMYINMCILTFSLFLNKNLALSIYCSTKVRIGIEIIWDLWSPEDHLYLLDNKLD